MECSLLGEGSGSRSRTPAPPIQFMPEGGPQPPSTPLQLHLWRQNPTRLTSTHTRQLRLCFLSTVSLLPPGGRDGSVGMLHPWQGMPRCQLAHPSPPELLCGPSPSRGNFAREALGGSFASLILPTEAVESPVNSRTPHERECCWVEGNN